MLFRSPGVFQGYYKNPEATRQTLEDGWMHSGDAGFLDHDGHLKIIDRAKDVEPARRRHDVRAQVPREQAQVLALRQGGGLRRAGPALRDALVNIDLAARSGTGRSAGGLPTRATPTLSQKPEVYELIQREVERVNRSLRGGRAAAGAQIRRFLILHKELDPDDEEITRTRKVRRGYVAQKYAALIEALYGAATDVQVEAQVTYEDGRIGHRSAPTSRIEESASATR